MHWRKSHYRLLKNAESGAKNTLIRNEKFYRVYNFGNIEFSHVHRIEVQNLILYTKNVFTQSVE